MIDQDNALDRWANRRAMAWISVVAALLFPALLLVTESDQLGEIAGPFYLFAGAVVGAYVGFATLDDRWQRDTWRDNDYGHGRFRSPRFYGANQKATDDPADY